MSHTAVLAFEIGSESLIGVVVGLVAGGASVAGIFDKRRRDLTQTWKDLYEAKSVEVQEVKDQVTKLSATVDLLKSDFVSHLAEGITEAVVRLMKDRQ